MSYAHRNRDTISASDLIKYKKTYLLHSNHEYAYLFTNIFYQARLFFLPLRLNHAMLVNKIFLRSEITIGFILRRYSILMNI
jgi:hypothetical protein